MTRLGQHTCVLAGLLLCLALAVVGIVRSPETVWTPSADEARPPARPGQAQTPLTELRSLGVVPATDAKPSSPRPRTTASVVPEGGAVLLVTIIWSVSMAILSTPRAHGSLRRALTTLSRRRTVPS